MRAVSVMASNAAEGQGVAAAIKDVQKRMDAAKERASVSKKVFSR